MMPQLFLFEQCSCLNTPTICHGLWQSLIIFFPCLILIISFPTFLPFLEKKKYPNLKIINLSPGQQLSNHNLVTITAGLSSLSLETHQLSSNDNLATTRVSGLPCSQWISEKRKMEIHAKTSSPV